MTPSLSAAWLLNAASLPIATPCSLQPTSPSQAQNERSRMTSCVRSACGMAKWVTRNAVPGP